MGSLTWHGWQTSLEDVFGATGILYGGNLRKRPKVDEQKETHIPCDIHRPVKPSRKGNTDKEGRSLKGFIVMWFV